MKTDPTALCRRLCLLLLLCWPLAAFAQEASPAANERIEIKFSQPQLLELELTRYLSSDVPKPRTFEVMATLAEPLKTERGAVILPAQTRIRLTASVRPGKYFGHAGEIVLWIDPFLIGKGVDGFACEPGARLLPQLCENTWRLSFDHQLDYTATPEAGRPMVLVRKRKHEGITGTRATRAPVFTFDQTGSNADLRLQTAANRFLLTGIVYEVSAAFTGAVRFLFSRRNLFLPTGTRVIFQLDHKLRLVPAADSEIDVIRFNAGEPTPKATR
ncbi:MAG: hypothetical protein SF339_19000, partial [Blastocatellia bacterium]|nr:hypothetical protein [Blastocatellia bacterium]